MSELQGLQLSLEEFEDRNCRVVAIVTDSPEQNQTVREQLGLTFPILSDPNLSAIDAFGLRHDGGPNGAMARPASFLVDGEGVVRWRDLTENYRVRPRPEAILAALDASLTGMVE